MRARRVGSGGFGSSFGSFGSFGSFEGGGAVSSAGVVGSGPSTSLE